MGRGTRFEMPLDYTAYCLYPNHKHIKGKSAFAAIHIASNRFFFALFKNSIYNKESGAMKVKVDVNLN